MLAGLAARPPPVGEAKSEKRELTNFECLKEKFFTVSYYNKRSKNIILILHLTDDFHLWIKCWKQYLSHRKSTEDGGPFPQQIDERFQRMIGNDPELPLQMEKLQELFHSFNLVAWNTQALLVSCRILSDTGINNFFLSSLHSAHNFLLRTSTVHAHVRRFHICC